MAEEKERKDVAVSPVKPAAKPFVVPEKFKSPSEINTLAMHPRMTKLMLAVTPKGINLSPSAISQGLVMAASANPELLECTPLSILSVLVSSAKYGVSVDPGYGALAYAIPRNVKNKQGKYEKVACFQTSWRGEAERVYRAGKIDYIQVELIHEQDFFEIQPGFPYTILHAPNISVKDRGPLVAVYAIAYTPNNTDRIPETYRKIFVTRAEIEERRALSKMPSVWEKHEPGMWKKTAVRMLIDRLPKSNELLESASAAASKLNLPSDDPTIEADYELLSEENFYGSETVEVNLNEALKEEKTEGKKLI